MDCEEDTSNVDALDDGLQLVQSETVNDGVEMDNGNDDGNVSSESSEILRLSKRRKLDRTSSVGMDVDDGDCSGKAAVKLANKCRNFIDQTRQTLRDDDSGGQGSTKDVHKKSVEDSDVSDEDRCKPSLQVGGIPNGIHCMAKGPTSNSAIDESRSDSGTNICQRAFHDIMLSEKFTSLSKLLLGNFQGTDKLLDLSLINTRMEEGAYESSPALFLADIEQFWSKLEGIGAELIFLTKSLSEISKACIVGKFGGRESGFHEKPEQPELRGLHRDFTCGQGGHKADGKDCLSCNSCGETCHVSCINPPFKDIPAKTWYCASCLARGIGLPHGDCIICDRLTQCNQAGSRERALKHSAENGLQQSQISKNAYLCKLCGSELQNGEKLKICDHSLCPNKYYHVRCLTSEQLKAYGPHWYCPSCLCRACLIDKDDDKIVMCDGCDQGYHLYCMIPPRTSIPRGKWFCTQCDLNMQKIRRARKTYEKYENRIKKKGKMMHETSDKKCDGMEEEEKPGKDRERMDMLLSAALKYEEKLVSKRALSPTELKKQII